MPVSWHTLCMHRVTRVWNVRDMESGMRQLLPSFCGLLAHKNSRLWVRWVGTTLKAEICSVSSVISLSHLDNCITPSPISVTMYFSFLILTFAVLYSSLLCTSLSSSVPPPLSYKSNHLFIPQLNESHQRLNNIKLVYRQATPAKPRCPDRPW